MKNSVKNCLITNCLLFISFLVNAQFKSINTIGFSNGESGNFLNLQTINGWQKRSWFGGIGLGLDYYQYKSLTTVITARKYLLKENNFGINASGGYNFPIGNLKKIANDDSFITQKYKGGMYSGLGVFYEFSFLKKLKAIISPEVNFRFFSKTSVEELPCLVAPCPQTTSVYKYRFQTFALKAGLVF